MGRRATGNVYESPKGSGHWFGAFTLPTGRSTVALPTCSTEAEAKARRDVIASFLDRLRKGGHVEWLKRAMERGAGASEADLPKARRMVDQILAGDIDPVPDLDALTGGTTFREFGEAWTEGRLRERWPDHIPFKRTANADRIRLKLHVYPHVEDVPLAAFRLEHAELVMRKLPSELSSASRRHIAQLLHRLLKLATYPARILAVNPLPQGFLPRVKSPRMEAWLYPKEDAALLAHTDAPLVERLLFGVLDREGLREGEGLALQWQDLDLERGTLSLLENKTDDPRAWVLDAGVCRALQAWKERYWPKAKPSDLVFRDGRKAQFSSKALIKSLRKYLVAAGGVRVTLTAERSGTRRPIRVHDLRATFITLSLAQGRSEAWISDRTGHKSSTMINRYKRAARGAAELELGALSPLDLAIPELNPIADQSPGNGSISGKPGSTRTRSTRKATHRRGRLREARFQNPLPSLECRFEPDLRH